MSPQLQTATSQEQQNTAQQQKSQVGRNPTFGVFNGTVDYGPAGKVQYENYCPAWAALSVFETTMDCIDKDRQETGKTGAGRSATGSAVANQIREIASRMPKKWKDRGILYKIANVIGVSIGTGMVVDVPTDMVAPVPGETTQVGGAIQPQEHGPGVTQDQLNWAFNQLSEGISDNASPQLRAAFQLLQLGLQAPPAERTAGRRQRGKKQHQYS